MTAAVVVFLAAVAAAPGRPDSIECLVYQRIAPAPTYTMALAALPAWGDPDSIMRLAPQMDFRRDGQPARSPFDTIAISGHSLSICARLDGPGWETCSVWIGSTLIGTFVHAPALGAGGRGRNHVTDGGRP